MSLRIWKVLKATVDLGALTLGGYAMSLGAQPFPVIAVVALIISGPELFEWLVVRKHLEGYRDTYDRGYNEQVKERDELRRVLEDEQRQEEERSEGPDR